MVIKNFVTRLVLLGASVLFFSTIANATSAPGTPLTKSEMQLLERLSKKAHKAGQFSSFLQENGLIPPSPKAHFSRDTDLNAVRIGLIYEAQKSIIICAYHISSVDIANALLDVAQTRSIHVTVIGSPETVTYYHAGKKRNVMNPAIRLLSENNDPNIVFKIARPPSGKIFHLKYMIIDDKKVADGSQNPTKNSVSGNVESLTIFTGGSAAKAYVKNTQRILKMPWVYDARTYLKEHPQIMDGITPVKLPLRLAEQCEGQLEAFMQKFMVPYRELPIPFSPYKAKSPYEANKKTTRIANLSPYKGKGKRRIKSPLVTKRRKLTYNT